MQSQQIPNRILKTSSSRIHQFTFPDIKIDLMMEGNLTLGDEHAMQYTYDIIALTLIKTKRFIIKLQ